MIRELFSVVFDISVISGIFILVVIVLRILLNRSPKWTRYFFWLLVALRLSCPLFFESEWSIIPRSLISTVENFDKAGMREAPDSFSNRIILINEDNSMHYYTETSEKSTDIDILGIASVVWIIGVGVLLIRLLCDNISVSKKINSAVRVDKLGEKIGFCEKLNANETYFADGIRTSFTKGLFRPKIFIPSNVSPGDIDIIIAHEKVHIKRKDYLWKQLGFIIVSIHWFNPMVWVGYILFVNDIELACDEKVIMGMDETDRRRYLLALIHSIENSNKLTFSTVAFGKMPIRRRLKAIMNIKKLSVSAAAIAIAAGIGVGAFFATRPAKAEEAPREEVTILEDGTRLITEKDMITVPKEKWEQTSIWSSIPDDEKDSVVNIETFYDDFGEHHIVTKIIINE